MPLKLAMCSCRWTVLSPRHNSFRAPQKRARPTSSSFPLPKHLTDGPEPRGLSRAATPAHMRGEMKNMGCGRSTLWAPTQRGLGGPYGTNCEREILLPGALYAHCPSSGTRSGALGLCTTTRNHSYLFFSFPPPLPLCPSRGVPVGGKYCTAGVLLLDMAAPGTHLDRTKSTQPWAKSRRRCCTRRGARRQLPTAISFVTFCDTPM
jgi:hypothetical protein